MRKSRAAHIKCDCGEKTSKCAHLQPTVEGHRGELEATNILLMPSAKFPNHASFTETCCCNHGGRCTCAGKKDSPLGTVPESDSDDARNQAGVAAPKLPVRRRRAATVHSSDPGGLSFDQHGHHKPSSKHNRAAQKCGPYQLNRVNSANSAGSFGTSSDNLLFGTRIDTSRGCGTREQRQVKSETASPLMSSSSFSQLSNANLPPLDLSQLDYPSYNPNFDLFNSNTNALPSDSDAPLFSAGLSTRSVDWSCYDLGDSNGESFTPSSYSQAGTQSFNGMLDFGSGSEQLPHLANTTSNSGDVSEVEDFLPGGDNDFEGFGAGNNSFLSRQANVANSTADLTSIDYSSFYKNDESNPPVGALSMVEDDPAFYMPNYNDGIATVDESPDPMGPGAMGNFWEI
ncbi:hypothetical protein PT974_03605 [Cladobotryum mycophilum]|uniref:Copper-fist domain-containing protein n=1 Tax=Cladobotryum mycophilum TaxID=491253 RepID=A0ABR0STF3_9HYPO